MIEDGGGDFWVEKVPDLHAILSGIPTPEDVPPWLALNAHSPEAIAEWIRGICKQLQITPTLLAKKAAIAPSTLNRFLSGKAGNLSATTLGSLSKVALDQIVFSAESIQKSAAKAIKGNKTIDVVVALRAREGKTQTSPLISKEDRYTLTIPTSGLELAIPLVGVEAEGIFLGEELPAGSVLVCYAGPFRSIPPTGIPSGVPYVVLRRHGQSVETTTRRLELDPSGAYWLAPLDKHFATSGMLFLGRKGDTLPTDVFLAGAVAGIYRALEHKSAK